MTDFRQHLINTDCLIKEALAQLNILASDAILFVVDEDFILVGSLTDGDVRRGFLKGLNFYNKVIEFIQPNPKFIVKGKYSIQTIIDFRNRSFRIVPVVDDDNRVVSIVNFRFKKSYLPIDVVVMAGGRGERLRPLTDEMPKPLLQVGNKPIIEHNIDRLASYGVDDFWLTLRYRGNQLEEYFGDGTNKSINIRYIHEDIPLGTIGAARKIENFFHDTVLVTNSDILTNLDYEDFFLSFIGSGADLSVVTIPYEVNVPYAVLETSNGHVMSFKEKPTYTYYSNGGIYLMKRDIIGLIPEGLFYNATDLMENLIKLGKKVHSYPLHGYWLDIGKMEDFEKAQQDIKHVRF
ncbi:MAG: nucleotidyltransferase family protein [Cyclobacteriaceae bacterium]|nr:nucleotidyltransferase family protein [Cyclobacteriaceae bacterium]